jgi:hypothetical protein
MEGCNSEVREHAHGTKGTLSIDDNGGGFFKTKDKKWRAKGRKRDNHHQEHHDMFAALREGRIYNEMQYGAEATMTSILGRMATYSGKTIKWEDALNNGADLSPQSYDFTATPPVVPDKDGFYPVPVPGKFDPFKA